jgi:hypothetical protein
LELDSRRMIEMGKASTAATNRISSFVLLVVLITLVLSFTALILSFTVLGSNPDASWILLLMGFVGVALSTLVLLQARRRMLRLRIVAAPVNTTIECKKCGFKSVREYQRGDYIFKEVEPCQKCNDKMLITAIYREVNEKEKEKEKSPFLG